MYDRNLSVHNKSTDAITRYVYIAGMDWKKEIGRRIRQIRDERLHLSLAELATATKTLSKARISNYEQGTRLPGPQEITTLAQTFSKLLPEPVSAAYLMCLEESPPLRSMAYYSPTESNRRLARLVELWGTLDDEGQQEILDQVEAASRSTKAARPKYVMAHDRVRSIKTSR